MKKEIEIDVTDIDRIKLTVEEIKKEDPNPPDPDSKFVKVKDGKFFLGYKEKVFAGTNGYYLPTYENINPNYCDQMWNLFKDSGLNLVRTWGFYDGNPQYDNDPWFQRFIKDSNGNIINEFNEEEDGLVCLDKTVAKAKENGIYLVIPLLNNWNALGGFTEYTRSVGLPDLMSNFINNHECQELFANYIEFLLNRINTVTGIEYKDEPTILSWQICNEARNPGQDPMELRNWYQNIASFIKRVDKNHLVSTGEEGFDDKSLGHWTTEGKFVNEEYSERYYNTYPLRANEGTSFIENIQIPEIDFGWFHWYPKEWIGRNVPEESVITNTYDWIYDHAKISKKHSKPVILGEYGHHKDQLPESYFYESVWDSSMGNEIGGSLIWQLADGIKANEYPGNIGKKRTPDDYIKLKNYFQQMIK